MRGDIQDNNLVPLALTTVTATRLPDSTTPAKRTHSRLSLLLSRIAAASLLHAALAPPSREPLTSLSLCSPTLPHVHLPSPSFRAAANTSRPRARSSRSLCLSFCRWPCRNSACWPRRPSAHDLLYCCWAQEPRVASSILPSHANRPLPVLAPHQLPLTISVVTVSECCSCSSGCR